jgi:hypothetical protein
MAFFRMFQLSLEILQYQPLENPTGSAMRREKGAKSIVNMLHLNPPWYTTCNCEIPDFSQWKGGSGLIAFMTRLTPSRLPEWVCNITLVSRLDQPLYSSLLSSAVLLHFECVEVPHSLWVPQLQAGLCSTHEALSRELPCSHSFVSFFSSIRFVPRPLKTELNRSKRKRK